MNLPRRSVRNAATIIADFQIRAPETTAGWIRFNEAVTAVTAAEQADTEQEEEAPVEVVAPDRSLIPYLNRLLGKIYNLNWFIKRRPFENTQDLDTKIKNYTEILDKFITDIMGTLPAISVDNFNTDVGNNLIERVFFWDRELALYFSYQYDAWDAFGNSLLAGTPGSSAEIHLDIGNKSKRYRTNLIESIKLLKEHIKKEYPLTRSSVARGRKKSHKRCRKKQSGSTRRKRKPRCNRRK